MNFTYDSPVRAQLESMPAEGLKVLHEFEGLIHDHADLVQMLSKLIGRVNDTSIGYILAKVKVRQGEQAQYAKTVADINRLLDSLYEESYLLNTPELLLDTAFVTTIRNFKDDRDITMIAQSIQRLSKSGILHTQDLIKILADFIIYKQYPTTLVSEIQGNHNLQALTQNLLRHANYGHDDFIRRVNLLDIAKKSETHLEGVQFIFDYYKTQPKQEMDYFIAYLSYSKDQFIVNKALELLIEKRSIQDLLYVLDTIYETPYIKRSLEIIFKELFETHRSQYFDKLYQLDLKHNNSVFYDYLVNNYNVIRDRITNDNVDDYKLTLISLLQVKPLFSRLHAKKKVSVINDLQNYAYDEAVMRNVGILLGQIPINELNQEIILGLSNVSFNATYAEQLIAIILKQNWELRRSFIVTLLESCTKRFYLKFLRKDIHKLYKNQYTVAELFVDLGKDNVHAANEFIYKKLDKLTKPWSESMKKERSMIRKAIWKKMSIADRLWLFFWPF